MTALVLDREEVARLLRLLGLTLGLQLMQLAAGTLDSFEFRAELVCTPFVVLEDDLVPHTFELRSHSRRIFTPFQADMVNGRALVSKFRQAQVRFRVALPPLIFKKRHFPGRKSFRTAVTLLSSVQHADLECWFLHFQLAFFLF